MTVRAIETGFPFEKLGRVATLESWRKEIHRPLYHVHKWWATRLGSVFRGILLGGLLENGSDLWEHFYRRNDFAGTIVLDPFMGSGTTLGEALKLGCRVIGCDINPVSYFLVRQVLRPVVPSALEAAYRRLEQRVVPKLRPLYVSGWHGQEADLLYAFWVKLIPCPDCGQESRLFSRWLFAHNADPGRRPEARALCPACGAINQVSFDQRDGRCSACRHPFNPQTGPAKRTTFVCEHCHREHPIAQTYRRVGTIPRHQLYALLLLLPGGQRVYKQPDADDLARYETARQALGRARLPLPEEEIPSGYNTDQARGYNYHYWRDMFNDRQLYSLGTLLREILKEPAAELRNQFLLLFSGTLEFNNLFCSFKGEGTGAVRHLFHHHILKPERTPLENNPWGTPKSSGTFSTLYRRRLLAAHKYAQQPFEVRPVCSNGKDVGRKVTGINQPLAPGLASTFDELRQGKGNALLFCADSSSLPIPDQSVDLVVTDPPYFDNVHYSELADFFYVWLRQGLSEHLPVFRATSTRSPAEVHGTDSSEFAAALGQVFRECSRVLKPDGLLIFTFQHSRDQAWLAVLTALRDAGLRVVVTHPVKAEMSVATPKNQAKEPINLDAVLVCRRSGRATDEACNAGAAAALQRARDLVARFNEAGLRLSRGDVRVILMGEFLRCATELPPKGDCPAAASEPLIARFARAIEAIHANQVIRRPTPSAPPSLFPDF